MPDWRRRRGAPSSGLERPPSGSFVRVTVKERDYWYFQQGARDASGRQPRKYVGPDSPNLRNRIHDHKQTKDDYRERRHLIATLRRAGFQGPPDQAGAILTALAAAGVFRLRACLVGTVAYQVYGPMLGVPLPHAAPQTGDIDIAQFSTVSIAIGEDEQIPSLLDVLQQAEPSFRAVPHLKPGVAASYVNGSSFRVDFLTENRALNVMGRPACQRSAPMHCRSASSISSSTRKSPRWRFTMLAS